jgi:mannose-6-phosphate isomerase-like protein (cupin superfamily)
MNYINIKDAQEVKTAHNVDVRKLYDKEEAQTIHIILKPGEALKRHITYTNVFFYVLEGKGIVEIGDEKEEVEKDTLIESPEGIPHCWYNESERDLRILVVKAPRPKNKAKLL